MTLTLMHPSGFKARLLANTPQWGLFCCSYSLQIVEALRPSGFDFLIFDAEHTPGSLPLLHAQLVALAGSSTEAIVRVPEISLAAFKLYLDLGVTGLMVPNVDSAEQARTAVSYTRFPPEGRRGMAGSVRATDYGRHPGQLQQTIERVSVLIQVESRAGLDSVDEIAAVDGVDAVFLGPNDLAADLGHLGQPAHPQVVGLLKDALRRIRRAGKAAGVLCSEADAGTYAAAGASVLALGSDLGLLVRAADTLATRCRANPATSPVSQKAPTP
ncbi:MAG: aldolase/citrate lyase family protein [Burkholderiaceae bacterium]